MIAPSAPKIAVQSAASAAQTEPVLGAGASETSSAHVEIPFVPARQRQDAAPVEPITDSIVVVGQASRKKRKRTRADATAAAQGEATPEPFDYSTVSNILDEGSDHEAEGLDNTRKRKQKTQGTCAGVAVGILLFLHLALSRAFRLWELPCTSQGTFTGKIREPVTHFQVDIRCGEYM